MDVNLLQNLETLNHEVSSIKHHYEEPYLVFIPEAFHDKNPFKIYTSKGSMFKLFFDLVLSLDAAALREVLSESRFC